MSVFPWIIGGWAIGLILGIAIICAIDNRIWAEIKKDFRARAQ